MNDNEEFIHIEDLKNDTERFISEINEKCEKLENIYNEYIKEAVRHPDYLTSLDILFYQIELTKEEIKNYTNLFNSFLSNTYGQYYKFYNKILHNLRDSNTLDIFAGTTINYDFTQYDDINFKFYSFEETQRIHNVILIIINYIDQYISRQGYKVVDDEIRIDNGININQLVYEKKHFIELFGNKRKLFTKILKNFYEYQEKFLKRMILKLKILYCQLDSDIQFETVTYTSLITDEIISNNKQVEEIIQEELSLGNINTVTPDQVEKKELETENKPETKPETENKIRIVVFFNSVYDIFIKIIMNKFNFDFIV